MKRIKFFLFSLIAQLPLASLAMAATEEAAKAAATPVGPVSLTAIGAGITMGLAALGGTLAQGKAAAAALEGIARNPGAAPKVQTPMILGLALIESLVLFAFVIAILLAGKVA